MKQIKVWPQLVIVAVACAVLAGVGVALWINHERNVAAESLPGVARIERVEGQVALNNGLVESEDQWLDVQPNTPVSVGDRLYTRDCSRTSLAFTGRNFATLDPNTSLDVLALSDRHTQLALRDGSAVFDLGHLAPGELFEVGTPYGAVDFEEPGLYQVGLDDNGGAMVSVLSGIAQVVGLGGDGRVGKGEILSILGQTAASIVLSRLQPDDAGYFVDDYYSDRYPQVYDGRYVNYDAYLADPDYYDPYRHSAGYQYASSSIPGLYDLDGYGDWVNVDGYGHAWRPRVDASWAPYQNGSWTNDYPYGPTWVSSEPWGYAPYHYGRWVNSGNQWLWVPDGVNTNPSYSPALVAFVPLNSDLVGWVPLAPSDAYAPRYYDTNWQSHYLYGSPDIQHQIVNLNVPGAVTVIPVQEFGNHFDHKSWRKIDKHSLANSRPVFDPLTVAPLRNAFLNSAWGRGKTALPPGIAKKLHARQIVSSDVPASRWLRKDVARMMRVEKASEKARQQKFEVRDERQDFKGTAVRIDRDLSGRRDRGGRGEQDVRNEMLRLKRDQFEQNRQQEKKARDQGWKNQAREQQQTQRVLVRQQQSDNARRQNEARRVNQQATWQKAQVMKRQKAQQQQEARQSQRHSAAPQHQRQALKPMRQPEQLQAAPKAQRRELKQEARPQEQPRQQKAERKQERPRKGSRQ